MLNLTVLDRLFGLSKNKVDLDYDNTVCFTKKQDAQRTYHKELGYIPGVGLVGSKIVYVGNRNGRSNAAVLQEETLGRMFGQLVDKGVKVDRFRERPRPYRFIVTKEKRRDGQINAFTGEACSYSVIVTNDRESRADDVVYYYNQRETIEKEFDVLKNDFGWGKLPFSAPEQNLVYLQTMAICHNLYHYIIRTFSKKVKGLLPSFRIKKFIFRFVAVPAKWVYRFSSRLADLRYNRAVAGAL